MKNKRLWLCLWACLSLTATSGCGGFWGDRHVIGDVKCIDGTQLADADARQAERFCCDRGGVDETTWTNQRDN